MKQAIKTKLLEDVWKEGSSSLKDTEKMYLEQFLDWQNLEVFMPLN